ncbi:hypothetical protein A2cp1_3426 [Anaeromyxobacter dehalogenans 2CP-1]|uniref:Uncharacterized protein n=1 Tax=Anaeromyxobacter dehalogenans (strain ATCC BAA-258 / DSM 21875 / 2CP-1) TaxID=455488 RepID=B8JHP4_ANAD2|nr:hypothetical protein [Anaeromyxobacter dehalogenans]ACL66756.1 hypothetical protein A2cp1_3426 [Anaeromyxobacter dehalogenans 2CP-1]
MTEEDAARTATGRALDELAAAARQVAAAFSTQLPREIRASDAIAAYAAARALADALAVTFGPNVRALADRVAVKVKAEVLTNAGLSSDGSTH